jgi:hypothetical protein
VKRRTAKVIEGVPKGYLPYIAKSVWQAIRNEFGKRWLFYLLLLISFPSIFFFMKSSLVYPDGIGYFSYTRSLVMDRDILLRNELIRYNISLPGKYFYPTHGEYISNPFAIGTALAWIPFFLIVHLLVLIANFFLRDIPILSNGMSYLYSMACSLSSCFYGILFLLLSFKLSKKLFSTENSLLAMLGIWFISPFVFCFYWMPTHSHLVDAFAVALFLLMWVESTKDHRLFWWFCFGFSFGFATIVRWQNILLGMLLLVPPKISIRLIPAYIFFFLGAFISFSPQLIVWKIIYGKFLTIPQGEGFMQWTHPEILKFLFSSWHGLYSWTPIILLSTIGLFLLYQKDKRIAIGFLLVFVSQVYVNSCVSDWWAGISFGARRMTGISLIFIVGLASFFSMLKNRRFLKCLILSVLFIYAWTLILSMLSAKDFLGDYHSWHDLLRIILNTLLNIKENSSGLTSYSFLATLKEYPLPQNILLAIKLIYLSFWIMLFFGLMIAHKWIIYNPSKIFLIKENLFFILHKMKINCVKFRRGGQNSKNKKES